MNRSALYRAKPLLLISMLFVILGFLVGCQSDTSIKGTFSLPSGQIAFEPLKVSISAVDAQTDVPLETIVLLPKGSNSVPFSIEGLDPQKNYYLRYWLLSQGGKGDNFGRVFGNSVQYSFLSVGGLSVLNQAYLKEGYLAKSDAIPIMTSKIEERKVYSAAELMDKPIALLSIEEPGVFEATKKLLDQLINPDMDDYQKQWAIYNYCVLDISNNMSTIQRYFKSEFNDHDNPLTTALFDKKAIWLGQPFLMHWLMANAGLQSELVEIHPYQSYYPQVMVMSRHNDAYYHSNPLLAAAYISESATETHQKYAEKYFNFPIQQHLNVHSKIVFREEQQRYFGRGSVYPPIKRILEENSLGEADLITIECKVQLPNGVYGVGGGIWGTITLKSANDPENPKDDLSLSQDFVFKSHKRSHTFKLAVVNTGAPITISFNDLRYGLTGSIQVEMPEDKKQLTLPCKMIISVPGQ